MMAENLDLAPPVNPPWETEPVISNQSSRVTAIMVIRAYEAPENHKQFEDERLPMYMGALTPAERMFVFKRVYDKLGLVWNEGECRFEPSVSSHG